MPDPKVPEGGVPEPPAPPDAPRPGEILAQPKVYPTPNDTVLTLIQRLRSRAATGQPVTASLPDPNEVLTRYDPEKIKEAGEKLGGLRADLEKTFRATVDIEAFGDPEYQQMLTEISLLRRRLETMGAESDEIQTKQLADLLRKLAKMEMEVLEIRTGGIQERSGAEQKLLTAQEKRERQLRRFHHSSELDTERDRGAHRQKYLAILSATEEIERQFRHRALTQPEAEQIVRIISVAEIAPTIQKLFAESDEQLKNISDSLRGLRGRGPMLITLLSQLASGVLSASGLAAMASSLSQFSDFWLYSGAGAMAATINGALYWQVRGHQTGSWRFFQEKDMPPAELPGPPEIAVKNGDGDDEAEEIKKPKRPRRRWLRLPTTQAYIYLMLSALSGVSNVGGMMRLMVPTAVVQSAMGRKLNDVTDFTANARKGMTANSDLANAAIAELRTSAQNLQNETVARGDTLQFGFKKESQKLLKDLDALYRQKIDDMVKAGNCDALKQLEEIYNKLYNDLENLRLEYGTRYAAAPFSKSLSGLEADKKTCEAKNPISPADLAKKIDELVKKMVVGVESGATKDPTELNPDIHELNRLMAQLGKIIALQPVQLGEMDPPMFEAVKLVYENFALLYDKLTQKLASLNPWKEETKDGKKEMLPERKLTLYPILFALFSEIIDQIGLILSLMIIANERRYLKKLHERMVLLSSGELQRIDNH